MLYEYFVAVRGNSELAVTSIVSPQPPSKLNCSKSEPEDIYDTRKILNFQQTSILKIFSYLFTHLEILSSSHFV